MTAIPTLTAEPLLVFEQVSKWYGPVLGLNQVTLDIREGITGLVGANGAGKSTLLRLATGQAKPSLGRVSIRGINAWDWQARRHVGYCPDHDHFYEDLSGRKFVQEMARLCGYSRGEAKNKAEAAIETVGMADRADRVIRGYSKGMRQRIKLAQALLQDPQLLVLDEPLSGIDPIGRQEMLDLFRMLAERGKCLLVSSHELEALEKLTNRVAIMARGRVAAVGTLGQIRDLLDDTPLSLRVESDKPKQLARAVLELPDVAGLEFLPGEGLLIKAKHPKRFFAEFGQLVMKEQIEITKLEPLDDSAHAILGLILGGSGKT